MHKEINLNGIRAIWRDFKLTICFFVVILIIISNFIFVLLYRRFHITYFKLINH